MITIQSGKMIIPEEERFVGFAGDDHSVSKQFILPQTQMTDVDAVCALYLRFDDDRVTSAPLAVSVVDSDTILTWDVRAEHLLKSGIVMAQLKLTAGDGSVTHCSWDYFVVGASAERADDGGEIDVLSRTEFEERMAQAVREAREIAPYIGDDGYWYVYSRTAGDYVRSISATNITVDSAMSADSAHPVENRAIKAYVDATDGAKVDKTRTIAGVDLQDDITAAELKTALSVPTKTSDLTNDSGFLTQHQDISGKMGVNASVPYDSENDFPDTESEAFLALPNGQVFASSASAFIPRYWAKYRTQSGSFTSSAKELLTAHQDISGKANVADIPTKTSDLMNDSGFLTAHQDISGKANVADIPTKTSDLTNDSGFLTAHQDISGKANVADIPTKTSDLTNDSGFLTAHQDISGKMGLAVVDVQPNQGQTAPDTTDSAYIALPDGQLFSCYLSGIRTYWIKTTIAPGTAGETPYPIRVGLYADIPDVSGKANVADIPTKTSDLTNDSGFLTAHQDISGKANVADIPTKTSDLTNDSGFLTAHQDISGKVDKTRKIAGINLQSDITAPSLKTALSVPTGTSDLTNDSYFVSEKQFGCRMDIANETISNLSPTFNDIVTMLSDGVGVSITGSDTALGVDINLPLLGVARYNGAIRGLVFGTVVDLGILNMDVCQLQITWQYGGSPVLTKTKLSA